MGDISKKAGAATEAGVTEDLVQEIIELGEDTLEFISGAKLMVCGTPNDSWSAASPVHNDAPVTRTTRRASPGAESSSSL